MFMTFLYLLFNFCLGRLTNWCVGMIKRHCDKVMWLNKREGKKKLERDETRQQRDWDQWDCLTKVGYTYNTVWKVICAHMYQPTSTIYAFVCVYYFFDWKMTKENASNMNNECDILKWKSNQVGLWTGVKPENNVKLKVGIDKKSNAYKYKYHIQANESCLLCLLQRTS